GQIEVIVYYQEIAQRSVVLMHEASYGFTTEIHKCPWLGQQQLLTPCFSKAYSSPALPVVKVNGMKPGEVIQAQEAHIMAIMGIGLTRVTQTNYEFH
ncbi:hypothetical protein MUP01_01675, partial [Candidatus Bathyarchaeota archaeon]|nr:hypothetical protein [Candidatus Bathyarchaeota archaeon]